MAMDVSVLLERMTPEQQQQYAAFIKNGYSPEEAVYFTNSDLVKGVQRPGSDYRVAPLDSMGDRSYAPKLSGNDPEGMPFNVPVQDVDRRGIQDMLGAIIPNQFRDQYGTPLPPGGADKAYPQVGPLSDSIQQVLDPQKPMTPMQRTMQPEWAVPKRDPYNKSNTTVENMNGRPMQPQHIDPTVIQDMVSPRRLQTVPPANTGGLDVGKLLQLLGIPGGLMPGQRSF